MSFGYIFVILGHKFNKVINLDMTQGEKWLANWKEVMDFTETNKRRPSKFIDEERGMRNWWKMQQKFVNAEMLKIERI